MEDAEIIALYRERNEHAISQTKSKYGKMIYNVAYNILHSHEDSEECENDTYLGAWNTIPPEHPVSLPAYLSRLARNISISRFRANRAEKRGGGEVVLSLHELEECIPAQQELDTDALRLAEVLNAFLAALKKTERAVFVCRYFRCDTVEDIAKRFGFGQSKVKMMLKRTRDKLRKTLEQEGYFHA